MAGSKDEKKQKPETNFVDDLDLMLNLDDTADESVGLIDDDDAIDRLLIDDAFEINSSSGDEEVQSMNDMDQLIAGEVDQDKALAPEFDEFGDDIDDLIADIQINPKQQKAVAPTELPALDAADVGDIDQSELETVDNAAEFLDEEAGVVDFSDNADISVDDTMPDTDDMLEDMAEIDEFSDEVNSASEDNADFLMADFDISTDDEFGLDEPESVEVANQNNDVPPETAIEAEEAIVEAEDNVDELAVPEQVAMAEQVEDDDAITLEVDESAGEVTESAQAEIEAEKPLPDVDYAALIAGLTAQVSALKKQQTKIGQDLQVKSNKDELTACLDSIDTLQSEQKKAKRNVDALNNRKPVSAYVANGLAILALIVGGSLGYQGYQAKNQAAQIIEYLGKMQAQINAVPTADGAEKEMLRNQLDELARADSITNEQIAELTKTVKGDGTAEATGSLGTQLGELVKQDMQMGAAIEALQAKVSALEKGKISASAAKPVRKPSPVITDNWVVNLVAFKQDWYAKRKAEEYASKGVPAKVSKAESKGETWYRLSVDGFKSQYEAAAYAARVKKTLNLDSVWLNKSKN